MPELYSDDEQFASNTERDIILSNRVKIEIKIYFGTETVVRHYQYVSTYDLKLSRFPWDFLHHHVGAAVTKIMKLVGHGHNSDTGKWEEGALHKWLRDQS